MLIRPPAGSLSTTPASSPGARFASSSTATVGNERTIGKPANRAASARPSQRLRANRRDPALTTGTGREKANPMRRLSLVLLFAACEGPAGPSGQDGAA